MEDELYELSCEYINGIYIYTITGSIQDYFYLGGGGGEGEGGVEGTPSAPHPHLPVYVKSH